MTWTEAKTYCEGRGGHLVTITSKEEQELVQALIKDGTKNQYWLGGQVTPNGWVWITGENWKYTNWGVGEPNDYQGTESYLQMYLIPNPASYEENALGKWNDINNENFIANEKDFFSTSLVGLVIEYDNGKPTSNHRYEVIERSMTWTEAKAHCESLGGHLATITTKEEQEIVQALIVNKTKKQYWLGGQVTNNGWVWVTGETWNYTNWGRNEPQNYQGTEGYLQMYRIPNPVSFEENALGKWNDINVNNTIEGEEDFFSLEHVGIICEYEK
jgi:putative hemolysin